MNFKQNVLDLIGHTPIMRMGITNIFAKLEYLNPAGSIKDRVAYAILKDALVKGEIDAETVIIEATSGNTGIGLAMCCAVLGLRLILTMPENMSIERRQALTVYGAEIVLTDANLGMQGALDKAFILSQEYKNCYLPKQFSNPICQNIHYQTTAKEIYNALDGKVDCFIAGVGTGGTISGVGRYLKEKNKNCLVVAVEPSSSPVLSKGQSGKHNIPGIGANFVPENYDSSVVDKIITISDTEAIKGAKSLARKQGLLVGISSGAVYQAALIMASMEEFERKNIAVIFPDTGLRYLSTDLFTEV